MFLTVYTDTYGVPSRTAPRQHLQGESLGPTWVAQSPPSCEPGVPALASPASPSARPRVPQRGGPSPVLQCSTLALAMVQSKAPPWPSTDPHPITPAVP